MASPRSSAPRMPRSRTLSPFCISYHCSWLCLWLCSLCSCWVGLLRSFFIVA
jgi:hypothetical protein